MALQEVYYKGSREKGQQQKGSWRIGREFFCFKIGDELCMLFVY